VVNKLSEERRKAMNEFVAILQMKVQIEFQYAKQMEELSEFKLISLLQT